MPIAQSLLPEFDHEMATTRKLLERVPLERGDWTPHVKSTPVGVLAMHIARLPTLAIPVMAREELDIASATPPTAAADSQELLAAFDSGVQQARAAIAGASDEALLASWSLKKDGQSMFTLPRVGVLRTLIMNHMIHHRGQLSVYLRLLDVPVPGIYGPSADEPF